MTKKKLILEDGTEFVGIAFGSLEDKKLELVFNTSMVGYQEILSDPSYTGQGVVMTYPLIGNYGMCNGDYETIVPSISAMIVREYCETPSNFRTANSIDEIMKKYNIAGISDVDTRQLARHVRDYGSCKACIVALDADYEETLKELKAWIPAKDVVAQVSTKEIYTTGKLEDDKAPHIVVIDCGIKRNILRSMAKLGCKTTVVPWNTPADVILKMNPTGVFISNGPGDPEDVAPTIETIRSIIGKLPVFGICLGHQIISLAYGAKTYKLKFGHRGGNHPVKNLATDKIEITSQNHSFAVNEESLKDTRLKATHINLLDNTIEGVECVEDKVFSVQYHPESAPGPQDSFYLFDKFIAAMKEAKGVQVNA